MYNAHKPSPDELPSTAQLLRSTVIAAVAASVVLVTTVFPAEFGVDPTGIGRLLGLTEMGEAKKEHAAEPGSGMIAEAQASETADPIDRSDVVTLTLAPGEDVEVKLAMDAGAWTSFAWSAEDGAVSYDTHGDGGGAFISYQRGGPASGADGVLVAAFDGDHGWWWSNDGEDDVTVTLRTKGNYLGLKRIP